MKSKWPKNLLCNAKEMATNLQWLWLKFILTELMNSEYWKACFALIHGMLITSKWKCLSFVSHFIKFWNYWYSFCSNYCCCAFMKCCFIYMTVVPSVSTQSWGLTEWAEIPIWAAGFWRILRLHGFWNWHCFLTSSCGQSNIWLCAT